MSTAWLSRVRPIPCIAASLAFGIHIALSFPETKPIWLPLAILATVATLVTRSRRVVWVLVLAGCTGALRSLADQPSPPLSTGRQVLSGTVVTPPRERRSRWSWQMDTGNRRLIVFQRNGPPPRWGDTVRFLGDVQFPDGPTNPGQFDYPDWLERQGIVQTVRTTGRVEVAAGPSSLWTRAVRGVRERVDFACRTRLRSENSGLASGILLSITDDIPYELRESFESTGTVHLLSTSGFHLATLASATATVLAFARPWTRSSMTLLLVWLIAIASGGGAAPLRSATMASLATIAPLLGRRSDAWNVLASAACLALIVTPKTLFDVGAQLSFATVGALILSSSAVRIGTGLGNPWHSPFQKFLRIAVAGLVVSTVAHAASSPLVSHHMFRFQPWAPLVNVPATVLGSTLLVNGAVAVLVTGVPGIDIIAWTLLDIQLTLLSRLIQWTGQFPGADVATAPLPMVTVVFQVALVLTAAAWASRRLELRERSGNL